MQVLEQLKQMAPERFFSIYKSLDQHGFGPLDDQVAKSLRFRPQAVRKLPMETRARRAKMLLETSGNIELTYELFGAYLMKSCRELVIGFLDATGVEHKDGLIEDLDATKPAKAKIAPTVADLDSRFAADDVTLYLALCAEQWSAVPELDKLWRSRIDKAR